MKHRRTEPLDDLLLRHLPPPDATELLLLRGHIIIERRLRVLVREGLANAEALGVEDLRYSRLARLGEALYGSGHLWEAIRAFNRARNQLAHELDQPKLIEIVSELLATTEPDARGSDTTLGGRLSVAIGLVLGRIESLRTGGRAPVDKQKE